MTPDETPRDEDIKVYRRPMKLQDLKTSDRILLPLMMIGAIVSTVQAFRNALLYSHDFQWSPASLLAAGINPYRTYLAGDPDGTILFSQYPNYLHSLYVMLLPLGLMDFEIAKGVWAAMNIGLGVASVYIVGRVFKLENKTTLYLLLIFMMSLPFRNTIGNGQHGLLVFVFLALPLLYDRRSSWIGLGIGFSKYSFGPAFALFYLVRNGVSKFMLAAIIPVAGWLLLSAWTGSPFIRTLFDPLRVSAQSVSLGAADIMSLTILLFEGPQGQYLAYILPVFLTLVLTSLTLRVERASVVLVLLSLICLLAFKHLTYDMVFLLPLAAWALRTDNMRAKVITGLIMAWMWFGLRLIPTLDFYLGVTIPDVALTFTNFALLSIAFWQVYKVEMDGDDLPPADRERQKDNRLNIGSGIARIIVITRRHFQG